MKVGSGYIRLGTGAYFSEGGNDVMRFDITSNDINNPKKVIRPIYEPSRKEIITRNTKKEQLHFITNIKEVSRDSEVLFICLGNSSNENGSPNLKYVLAVAKYYGKQINDCLLVVTKSTVPIATSKKVKKPTQDDLNKRNIKMEFDVLSNPEFLKEKTAFDEFLKPDRFVIRLENEIAEDLVKSRRRPFKLNGHPIHFMDILSAEMIRFVDNFMLTAKISFIDDIANLCKTVEGHINKVRKGGIRSNSLIGHKSIYPKTGYCGSCFPKAVQALTKTANEHNYELNVLKSVEAAYTDQKLVLFNKIMMSLKGYIKYRSIALRGLPFKPQTDDMREDSSLYIVKNLSEADAVVKTHDLIAINKTEHHFENTTLHCEDQHETLIDTDRLAILTNWLVFKIPNFKIIRQLIHTSVIFDGRNIYYKYEMKESGFDYFCLSRDPSKHLIKY